MKCLSWPLQALRSSSSFVGRLNTKLQQKSSLGLGLPFFSIPGFCKTFVAPCFQRYSQDDIENFKTSVLTAMDSVRPVKCGILPLPTLGVHRPPKEKLKREVKLPEWMYRQLECNQAPGRYGGQALGHAAMLELAKRETLGTFFMAFISDPWLTFPWPYPPWESFGFKSLGAKEDSAYDSGPRNAKVSGRSWEARKICLKREMEHAKFLPRQCWALPQSSRKWGKKWVWIDNLWIFTCPKQGWLRRDLFLHVFM